jgi:uncharacterized integral membrane protein (TIGR00697 family)
MKNFLPLRKEFWKSHSSLKVILTIIFVMTLLVSNVITWRQIMLPFWITMTGAMIIFPITYILSDVFSEVYGYGWSRITCYIWFVCNLLMSLIFMIIINMKAPEYFTNTDAYSTVLWNTWRILFASLFAYVIWDFVNDRIFQKMKLKHPHDNKWFWWRAILSSLAGETVDSWIFIPLAFVDTMPSNTLFVMIFTQIVLKVCYEIVILPFTIYVTKKAQVYENNIKHE